MRYLAEFLHSQKYLFLAIGFASTSYAGGIIFSDSPSDPRLQAHIGGKLIGVPLSNHAESHLVFGQSHIDGFGRPGNYQLEEVSKFADLLSPRVYYIDSHLGFKNELNIAPIEGRLQKGGLALRQGRGYLEYDASFLRNRPDIDCVFLGNCLTGEDLAFAISKSSGKPVLAVSSLFEPSTFAAYRETAGGAGEILTYPPEARTFHLWQYDEATDSVSVIDALDRDEAAKFLGMDPASVPELTPNSIVVDTPKGKKVFSTWREYNKYVATQGRSLNIEIGRLPRGPIPVGPSVSRLARVGAALGRAVRIAGPGLEIIDIANSASQAIQKGCSPVGTVFFSAEQANCAETTGQALVSSGWSPIQCLTPGCDQVHARVSPENFGRYLWSHFMDDVPGVSSMPFESQQHYFSQYVFEVGQRLHPQH